MTAQTIHEAATTTGWSPRMLRYVEQLGLVRSPRSAAGYRLYGPEQLRRLRTLRELLERHGLELGDIAFALRLRREPEVAAALDAWFAADPTVNGLDAARPDPADEAPVAYANTAADPVPAAAQGHQPAHPDTAGTGTAGTGTPDTGTPDTATGLAPADLHWLGFEQDKHQQLLRQDTPART